MSDVNQRAYVVNVASYLVGSHGFRITEAYRALTWKVSSDLMLLGYPASEVAALVTRIRDKRVEYEGYHAE